MRSWTRRPTALSASAVTTAASIPKQRLRPRATLYSPPPSQTWNVRVVATRPSPGSRRSITSPRLTMSQRQSFFDFTVKAVISFSHNKAQKAQRVFFFCYVLFVPFCGSLELSWLELWRQQVKDKQGREIRRSGDDKDWHVAAGAAEYLADEARDHHAAYRARHAADAHHRPDCVARKHV